METIIVSALLIAFGASLVINVLQLRNRRRAAGAMADLHRAEMASLKVEAMEVAASIRDEAIEELDKARRWSQQIIAEGEQRRAEIEDVVAAERAELRELRAANERRESRLAEREERVCAESEALAERSEQIDAARNALESDHEKIAAEWAKVAAEREQINIEKERVARLSSEEAKAEVLAEAEHSARLQATALSREIEAKARQEGDAVARQIIVGCIQRLASEQTSESVVLTVDLPSDEMKGRIIGREGRNIRAFEQVTGVNVMIDDTPEAVLISCFDPVRRETARLTLIDLVADGRIHPARIEELYERNTHRIKERIQRAAEDALAEVGISDLHPELIPILGTLLYRTSYGQNVLRHLVECAHLAGLMAAELGLDVAICKRAAFLHDIGKALTHQVEGPHALIGADLARKYGECPDVVHAIEAHHNEVPPETVEAVLTQAVDAISGSRPGARRESLEAYVERMQHLESMAASHEGVDRVYAMQAGRELRVMVLPEVVDDLEAQAIARDVAQEIEKKLSYPGQVKVTVVRESRATEIAH